MQPFRAHVQNGRLVIDEPTNLPEGEVVYLTPVDGIQGADFDADERSALHQELQAAIAEADAGQTDDFARVIAELQRQL